MNTSKDSVTIAVTDHVERGVQEAYESRVKELHGLLELCPGFLSADTVRHIREHIVEYTILLRFADHGAAHNWEARPEIMSKLKEVKNLTGGEATIVEATGLGMWVDHKPGVAPVLPPFWKRVVLSVLGVYPMLLVLLAVLGPQVQGLPRPLQTFCIVVVLACLLTWPIMPTLGKYLGPWLQGKA